MSPRPPPGLSATLSGAGSQLAQVAGLFFSIVSSSANAAEAESLLRLAPVFMMLSKAKSNLECKDTG